MKVVKYVPIGLCLLITIASVFYARHEKRLREKSENKVQLVQNQVQAEAEIISRNVDSKGLNHVIIEATKNIIPLALVKQNITDSEGILDTTAMAIGVLKKQIQNVTIINTTLYAQNLKLAKQLDSAGRTTYNYSDKYLTAKFTPPIDSTNDGLLDFSYNADLNIAQYQKRKWFLAAKKSYIDIYSNDTRTTVNGVKRLVVEQNKPDFGLRLQLRSVYSLTTKKLYAGPGVSFDFNRYNILGYSYYNLSDNKWQYVVGLNYDLIRF